MICLVFGTAARAEEEAEGSDVPEPVPVSLDTKDGVKLSGMFYCNRESKETIPVVFLHDYKGTYHVFDQVASQLHQKIPSKETTKDGPGFAVLIVDLRGHGGSTRQTIGGQTRELDASKFNRLDIFNMIRFDMEAVRKFLVDKNDEGKLNLNKLCLVGAGMGATVAANWTLADWKAPPLATTKQGQDVKGLVLVSPTQVFMGVPIRDALLLMGVRNKVSEVSVLIICGKQDSQAAREANRIYKLRERFHPEPPENERQEKQNLFFQELETSNQGGKLFESSSLGIEELIAQFIELRLVAKEHDWIRRRQHK
ncbi:MAG: alpha/beta fold hydrolase [Pirellulales bacterium]|nr:alpha/beta fold hydrolase [Pirellulales bacterium]